MCFNYPNRAVFAALVLLYFPLSLYAEQALKMGKALEELDGMLYWDSFFQSGVLQFGTHNVVFESGGKGEAGEIVLDGKILSCPLPWAEDGNLYFPAEMLAALKQSTAVQNKSLYKKPPELNGNYKVAAIIIDPGHGGKDPGAISETRVNGKKIKLVEKDITLAVGKDLYSALKNYFPDKKVLITRTSDTYPTLKERVAQANSVKLKDNEAIIYISVHANFSFNKSARGLEVWYLPPEHTRQVLDKSKFDSEPGVLRILNEMLEEEFNRESTQMAKYIAEGFNQVFGKALPLRRIAAEDYYVVKNARMPSVLVELGFISNESDAALFTAKGGLKKFSDSIYKGITAFVENFESSAALESSGGIIAAREE